MRAVGPAPNRGLGLRGRPALNPDAVRHMIGDGAKILVERALAAYSSSQFG